MNGPSIPNLETDISMHDYKTVKLQLVKICEAHLHAANIFNNLPSDSFQVRTALRFSGSVVVLLTWGNIAHILETASLLYIYKSIIVDWMQVLQPKTHKSIKANMSCYFPFPPKCSQFCIKKHRKYYVYSSIGVTFIHQQLHLHESQHCRKNKFCETCWC